MIQKGLFAPKSLPPLPESYPHWYDPSAHCEYHEGAYEHSLDSYLALKAKVQDLINKKILSFKETRRNVQNNPFPAHGEPTINVIEEVSDTQWIRVVKEVKTLLTKFHAGLVESCLIGWMNDKCVKCSIQPRGFLIVQRNIHYLMDQGVVQISRAENAKEVSLIEIHFELPTSMEITYQMVDNAKVRVNQISPVVICFPSPFPFERTKDVP